MRSVTFEALWRDGPVNAQPGAPPGRKIHWDADESVVFFLQHARQERQRTRRRFRGGAANAASTDAAELAKVSLTSRLPFTSCQIKGGEGAAASRPNGEFKAHSDASEKKTLLSRDV